MIGLIEDPYVKGKKTFVFIKEVKRCLLIEMLIVKTTREQIKNVGQINDTTLDV